LNLYNQEENSTYLFKQGAVEDDSPYKERDECRLSSYHWEADVFTPFLQMNLVAVAYVHKIVEFEDFFVSLYSLRSMVKR
jgi:hypothetical protein